MPESLKQPRGLFYMYHLFNPDDVECFLRYDLRTSYFVLGVESLRSLELLRRSTGPEILPPLYNLLIKRDLKVIRILT